MRKVRKRSAIPFYGTAAVWALYCLIFPLWKPSHFVYLIAVAVVSYCVLSKLFPGTTEIIKEPEMPVSTGSEEGDRLLREGEAAVSEMKRLRKSINNPIVTGKVDELISVTEKIFADIIEDPDDIPQIRRFANYYLPTTIKLLNAYDRMDDTQIEGDNVSGTMERIENILDTTILAYNKQLDALFANQALDIETDITVLESMLKREGLADKDF